MRSALELVAGWSLVWLSRVSLCGHFPVPNRRQDHPRLQVADRPRTAETHHHPEPLQAVRCTLDDFARLRDGRPCSVRARTHEPTAAAESADLVNPCLVRTFFPATLKGSLCQALARLLEPRMRARHCLPALSQAGVLAVGRQGSAADDSCQPAMHPTRAVAMRCSNDRLGARQGRMYVDSMRQAG